MTRQPFRQVHDDRPETSRRPLHRPQRLCRRRRADPPRRRTPSPGAARAARWSRTTSAARPLSWPMRRARRRRDRGVPDRPTRGPFRWRRGRPRERRSPGSLARAVRSAAAMTGVETGRRPLPASRADPRSSASRYTVTKETAARPSAPPTDRSERPRSQQAAGGHADVVGGDDDGHGVEGLVAFGLADGRRAGPRPPAGRTAPT